MDASILIGGLFAVTFLLVIGFALRSKKQVEELRENPEAIKSTLAADAPNQR